MAVKAYILIEVEAGMMDQVVRAVKGFTGVKTADAVTGPYDAIAVVEAQDLDALGTLIKQSIQRVEGVTRTLTCISIS